MPGSPYSLVSFQIIQMLGGSSSGFLQRCHACQGTLVQFELQVSKLEGHNDVQRSTAIRQE